MTATRPMTTDRFRECLAIIGWTQNELARQLGINGSTAHQYARGIRPIQPELAEWLENLTTARIQAGLPRNWKNGAISPDSTKAA